MHVALCVFPRYCTYVFEDRVFDLILVGDSEYGQMIMTDRNGWVAHGIKMLGVVTGGRARFRIQEVECVLRGKYGNDVIGRRGAGRMGGRFGQGMGVTVTNRILACACQCNTPREHLEIRWKHEGPEPLRMSELDLGKVVRKFRLHSLRLGRTGVGTRSQ